MNQWKTLEKKTILDHNKFLRVEQHKIQLPDGKIINNWPWVISPDYVLVLPITEDGKVLLFRQTKYAIEGTSLAPVGGHLEPSEDPLVAAKRELREEMGCEASEWIQLGAFPNNGNNGAGKGYLFLALSAKKVGDPIIDDLEEMELQEYSIEEVEKNLLAGEVKVMGWAAMVALALLYLRNNPSE